MQFAPRGVTPAVVDRQIKRYREMSPSEKLALADALWDLAFEATKAGVRMRDTALGQSAVEIEALRLLRNAAD